MSLLPETNSREDPPLSPRVSPLQQPRLSPLSQQTFRFVHSPSSCGCIQCILFFAFKAASGAILFESADPPPLQHSPSSNLLTPHHAPRPTLNSSETALLNSSVLSRENSKMAGICNSEEENLPACVAIPNHTFIYLTNKHTWSTNYRLSPGDMEIHTSDRLHCLQSGRDG